jgi:hypothetical protein
MRGEIVIDDEEYVGKGTSRRRFEKDIGRTASDSEDDDADEEDGDEDDDDDEENEQHR